MANKKRLIYLDHALQAVSENYRSNMPKHELDMLTATRKRLKSLPTVDAVEVVRCKDCKQYNGHRYCYYFAEAVLDNDFCSYGERKDHE